MSNNQPFVIPYFMPKEWIPIREHLLCLVLKEDNTQALTEFLDKHKPNEPYINLLKNHGLFLNELRKLELIPNN